MPYPQHLADRTSKFLPIHERVGGEEILKKTLSNHTNTELCKIFSVDRRTVNKWCKAYKTACLYECRLCPARGNELFEGNIDVKGRAVQGLCMSCMTKKRAESKLRKKLRNANEYDADIFDIPDLAWKELRKPWGKGGIGTYHVQTNWWSNETAA